MDIFLFSLTSCVGSSTSGVFGSGVSAITAVASTLKAGDLVLCEENLYGCTVRLFEKVFEKFGVMPKDVIDVQALAGDSVDNVPGAPGIGIKTAAQLITEFGSLDNLLENAEAIKQPKRREILINSKHFTNNLLNL